MSKWNKKDWAEVVIIFGFLTVSVILLGAVAALLGEVIIRLLG